MANRTIPSMRLKNNWILAFLFILPFCTSAQEGIPIYSDYITDNNYLIHPSMAGAANCGQIRVTGRQQWFGQDNAPALFTVSGNTRIGDSPSAVGALIYSDRNGFHSQVGAYLTYAHHIQFSRSTVDLNQLSFGLSAGFIQYQLDETEWLAQGFDPIVSGIELSATNFNIDLGFSYNYLDFYAHGTVKNILNNDGINVNEQGISFNNLRTYLGTLGYVLSNGNSEWAFEPSAMFMYREATEESFIDANFKAYRTMDFGTLWGGISYRRSLDGAQFADGTGVSSQKLQYFTPFIGVDYGKYVFAYTYSYQANSVVFDNGGFHQITIGINFNCQPKKYDCNCPYVN